MWYILKSKEVISTKFIAMDTSRGKARDWIRENIKTRPVVLEIFSCLCWVMGSWDFVHFITLLNLHVCFIYSFEYITYYIIKG